MTKARLVGVREEDEPATNEYAEGDTLEPQPRTDDVPTTRRVQIKSSPVLDVFHEYHPITLTIDTGYETNMILESVTRKIRDHITKSTQSPYQADGKTSLNVIGETRFTLSRDGHDFFFEGLVVTDIDVEVLAGTPIMITNDITVRPARREINLSDNTARIH